MPLLSPACSFNDLESRALAEESIFGDAQRDRGSRTSSDNEQTGIIIRACFRQAIFIIKAGLLQVKRHPQFLIPVEEFHGCGAIIVDTKTDAGLPIAVDK